MMDFLKSMKTTKIRQNKYFLKLITRRGNTTNYRLDILNKALFGPFKSYLRGDEEILKYAWQNTRLLQIVLRLVYK